MSYLLLGHKSTLVQTVNMKTFILVLLAVICMQNGYAQQDSLKVSDSTIYRIQKNDGVEFIGYIISRDNREILVLTEARGAIYIPKHVIKEIAIVDPKEYNASGEYIGEDMFATRYFITTNGLPMRKGEHYVQWNWFGPDFQFGVGKNFGVGVMTSWLAVPIIATAKYSFRLGNKSQFAIGTMAGSTSWAAFADSELNFGGVLPFGTLSFGNRRSNIAFSGGYGAVWMNKDVEGRALTSVAGMIKLNRKISLVFDSFILLPGGYRTVTDQETIYDDFGQPIGEATITSERKNYGFALLIPGIRWHRDHNSAFQFGFTGILQEAYGFLEFPIPMVQWYRSL